MAATNLSFVLPMSFSFRPSFDRRNGFRVSLIRCSASSLTSSIGANSGLVEKPWTSYNASLVLEDVSIWTAKSFGATGTRVAELVFNTSLTCYQEILTDPSYAGQFVLMTNPQIGNTVVNPDDEESVQCFLAGLVIRSLSISTSNWRCTKTFDDYLTQRNIIVPSLHRTC